MISFSSLSCDLGGQQILVDVSATVLRGSITAVLGPTGGGKSTLLRTVALLNADWRGSITIGPNTYTPSAHYVSPPWPALSMVFQEPSLWPHLTGRQNITLPVARSGRASPKEALDRVIRIYGLQSFIDRHPSQMSGGQRQLVAIARADALSPEYLLLDEVTASLDVETTSIVTARLRQLRDSGVAIMLVTHLLGFAARAADNVIFMEHGRIIEAGASDRLESPQSSRLAAFLSLANK